MWYGLSRRYRPMPSMALQKPDALLVSCRHRRTLRRLRIFKRLNLIPHFLVCGISFHFHRHFSYQGGLKIYIIQGEIL